MEFIKPDINIDFVGRRRFAFAISLGLIFIGLAALLYRGGSLYGIDFAGGTVVQLRFKDPTEVKKIRQGLKPLGLDRSAIQRFFDEHGVTFHTGIEMSSNEAIKQAVEAGLGLGIVSIHTLELELATETLMMLDVEDFPIMRHWHIVQRAGKRLSPVAQAFKQFVLEEAEQFIHINNVP